MGYGRDSGGIKDMTSKPYGILETTHLQMLKDSDACLNLIVEAYCFRANSVWIDERTGEMFCDLLGSLMELRNEGQMSTL
jgi:hypothetical protein